MLHGDRFDGVIHLAAAGVTPMVEVERAQLVAGETVMVLGATGVAGQLARRVAERLKLRQEMFLAELTLEPFYSGYYEAKNSRRYEALPRFPAVDRDFSLLLTEGTLFSDVRRVIDALKIPEMNSVEAADLFRGKNVPAGKYSLLVRVKFQSYDATLTDAQISDYSARIVAALTSELGAQLRA